MLIQAKCDLKILETGQIIRFQGKSHLQCSKNCQLSATMTTLVTSEVHPRNGVYYPSTDKQTEMKKKAFEKWMAYLIICNSDQAKYGSITNGLSLQFSMGHNQWPTTITAATDILSNH